MRDPRSPGLNSSTSRDFPTPAGPSSVKRYDERCDTTLSKSSRSRWSSRSRPTIGESRRRTRPADAESMSSSRYAATGALLPLSSSSTASTCTASRTSCCVSCPIKISPGSAFCSSRAATLTASPVTSASPSPATTSPVLTPIRACSPIVATAARSSTAARTARSASSSCACGTPKTAITASPMNFSTVPAVPLEDRARVLEVPPHRRSHGLGVVSLPERGRARQVAEDDRDGLPDLTGHLGLLERRAAGAAELEPLWIFLAAACASPHSS